MNIIMPFKVHDGKKITDAKVMGGLERFAQLLYTAFNEGKEHEIIPILIDKDDRSKGKTAKRIASESKLAKADLILSNYEEETYTTKLLRMTGLPVVWIYHTAYDGTYGRVKAIRLFKKFTDMGGHLYFVSKHQHMIYNRESMRIMGHEVENVRGYVNPAYCSGNETVSTDLKYDVTTIARTSYMKDPFYIHRALDKINSSLTSAVVTTGGHHLESPKEKKYYEDNLKYEEDTAPRTTFRDKPHDEGMKIMSSGKVFVSTWPLETFGITALESLSHGLPTILLTDSSKTHASEDIAADSWHIRLIEKTAPAADLEAAIRELSAYTEEQRAEISRLTKAKHSKSEFVKMYTNVFTEATKSI